MKFKRIFLLVVCFLTTITCVVDGAKVRYAPPFTHITGDRLDANMPEPFTPDNYPKILLADEEFPDENMSDLKLKFKTNGWNYEDGVITVNKTDGIGVEQFILQYSGNLIANGYYVFTCKIKSQDVTGGRPRCILSAYKDEKWLKESGDYVNVSEKDSSGWYTMFQVLKLPIDANNIRISAQIDQNVGGTFYYDDFKLYQIALDPMEMVLCQPNYKGLIYGDGIADIDLDICIKEMPGFYNYSDMSLCVELLSADDNIIRSSNLDSVNEKINVVFSSEGLPEGTYYLQCRLTDKRTGKLISKKEQTLRKVGKNEYPAFYLDNKGNMIKDGEKYFLKSIYSADSNDYNALSELLPQTVINSVCHVGMGPWYMQGDANVDNLIQTLSDNNKTIMFSLQYWWGNQAKNLNMSQDLFESQRDIRSLITAVINDRKNDTALGGYYLFDEPNTELYDEEICWNNDIIADIDLDHPTYGITDNLYENYGVYTKMCNVLGVDPYPISGKETDDIASVGRGVRNIVNNFPNRPVYLCLQGFNWRAYYGDGSRGPNYQELRNMAYQAICEGARGLECYGFHEMDQDPSGKTFNQWWGELTDLYADIEKYENIILSDEPSPEYLVSNAGQWLNITTRRYNGKSYMFAVNNTKSKQNAYVKINNGGLAKDLDTNKTISPMMEGYYLSFEPLEVKILEVDQPDYLSPEAELIALGFFNCSKVFSVTEAGENIINITDDSVILNYRAKISDGAKLYINGVEKPVKGKISIRNADSFTVTVKAQDGKSKTEHKYCVARN